MRFDLKLCRRLAPIGIALLVANCSDSSFVGTTPKQQPKPSTPNSGAAVPGSQTNSSESPSSNNTGGQGSENTQNGSNHNPSGGTNTLPGTLQTDDGVLGLPQPTQSWACGLYTHDPNPHSLPLSQGFIPAFSQGYRLAIRPGLGHCTGGAFKVTITGNNTGLALDLPCRGNLCDAGAFVTGIRSKDAWDITPNDLKSLAGNTSYTLSFVWIKNVNVPGSTCFGDWRGGYGLAFSLTRALDSLPPSTATECSAFDTSN